jgi:hypothetical protein
VLSSARASRGSIVSDSIPLLLGRTTYPQSISRALSGRLTANAIPAWSDDALGLKGDADYYKIQLLADAKAAEKSGRQPIRK